MGAQGGLPTGTVEAIFKIVDQASPVVFDAAAKIDRYLAKIQKSMENGAGSTRQFNTALDQFSGKNVAAKAYAYANAIDAIGGASKLTAQEQAQVNQVVTTAIEKFRVLGKDAPEALTKLAAATAGVPQQTGWWTKLSDQVKATALGFISATAVIGIVQKAFGGLTKFISDSIQAAAEAEAAQKRLATALISQHTTAAISEYKRLAEQFQETTVYSNDLVIEMEALLVQVGNVMPDQMKGALTAATDLASGLGMDLRQATMLVAKAFAGGGDELGRLKAILGDTVKEGAGMAEILAAIEAKFGGQARAEVDTYRGAVAQLGNAWNNFETAVGHALNGNETLQRSIKSTTSTLNTFAGAIDAGGLAVLLAGTRFYELALAIGGKQAAQTGHDIVLETPKVVNAIAAFNAEVKALTQQGLVQLTREQRAAVLAGAAVGKSTKEMAEALHISELAISRVIAADKEATAKSKKYAEAVQKQTKVIVDRLRAFEWTIEVNQRLNAGMHTNLVDGVLPLSKGWELWGRTLHDQFGPMKDTTQWLVELPTITGNVTKEFVKAAKATEGWASKLSGMTDLVVKGLTGGGGIGGAINAFATDFAAGFVNAFAPGVGSGLAPVFGTLFGKIGGLFGKSKNRLLDEKATEDIKKFGDEWVKTAGGIDRARRMASAFGIDLDGVLNNKGRKGLQNVQADLGAVDAKWGRLQAAMDKYGITVERLGPKFKQLAQDDWADQILADFNILVEAGMASADTITAMADEVNGFVQRSLRMGTEVPEAMRPMIEQMISMGLLTDENGNAITALENSGIKFGKTMTEAMDGVRSAIEALPDAIARALGKIPDSITIPVDVPVNVHGENYNPDDVVPGFARGTKGYQNFGPGTLTMLHGWEKVTPLGQDASSGGGSSRPLMVNLIVNGRTFAQTLLPDIAAAAAQQGLA